MRVKLFPNVKNGRQLRQAIQWALPMSFWADDDFFPQPSDPTAPYLIAQSNAVNVTLVTAKDHYEIRLELRSDVPQPRYGTERLLLTIRAELMQALRTRGYEVSVWTDT